MTNNANILTLTQVMIDEGGAQIRESFQTDICPECILLVTLPMLSVNPVQKINIINIGTTDVQESLVYTLCTWKT